MANEQDSERQPSGQGAKCVVELGVWLARKKLERKQRADTMKTTRQVPGAQCVVELWTWMARKELELERKQRADIMRTTRQVQVDNDE